jgi:hypothetical protein
MKSDKGNGSLSTAELVSGSFDDPASRQQPCVWQWVLQHKATQAGLRRPLSIQTDDGHMGKVAADEAGQGCSIYDEVRPDGHVPTSETVASSTATAANLSTSNVHISNSLS